MFVYQSPGLADPGVSDAAIADWNCRIRCEFGRRPASPFLRQDPGDVKNGQPARSVQWPGHPREPLDCLGETRARQLSDLGWPGRAELHNEYLEYGLVMRRDGDGNRRPKRFVATTELKEWWLSMAVHDIDYFLTTVEQIAGRAYSAEELFEHSRDAWRALSVPMREKIFGERLVGRNRGVAPQHPLNIDHLLFMAHTINGLDDLIYVVHFGSFPYAVREAGGRRRARLEEIFSEFNVEFLLCRNADPGAAQGAYDQVYLDRPGPAMGHDLAFAGPLGMYMRDLSVADLTLDGGPVPADWTRWSRGHENGMAQRVEFGPPDSSPRFLDEVLVGSGAGAAPVTGYELARAIEVGPIVLVSEKARAVTDAEFVEIPAVPEETIRCGLSSTTRCRAISAFAGLVDGQTAPMPGTRGQTRD